MTAADDSSVPTKVYPLITLFSFFPSFFFLILSIIGIMEVFSESL